MNPTGPYSIRRQSDCGCCEGLGAAVPVEVKNRAGLVAIAYRIGTHAQFKASLLARLSAPEFSALQALRSREDEDFTVALLDAWAVMADVLTFYIERGAQESYLRTATERLSIVELARLIGYKAHPGVAASTSLAFTLEETPGSPERIRIDRGTKVQSTPGPDETAQIFETVEAIEARPAWNAIRPRRTRPHPLQTTTRELYFQGVATQLAPGDGVLFESEPGTPVFAIVTGVDPNQDKDFTRVRIHRITGSPKHEAEFAQEPEPSSLAYPASAYEGQTLSAPDLESEAKSQGFQVQDIFDVLAANPEPAPQVLVFRKRASIFGHNAPDWNSLPESLRGEIPQYEPGPLGLVIIEETLAAPYKDLKNYWPGGDFGNLAILNKDDCPGPTKFSDFEDLKNPSSAIGALELNLAINTGTPPTGISGSFELKTNEEENETALVFLDNVYADIAPDSIVVLKDGKTWGIYEVKNATELSKSCFTITAKVTRLTLDDAEAFDQFFIRGTTVYAKSEWLPLAQIPDSRPVPVTNSQTLELEGWVDGLSEGQQVVLSGREIDGGEEFVSEFVFLDQVDHILGKGEGTRITFTPALQHQYLRETVTINANLAPATHGESVQEVLGGGDARQSYQQFVLRQTPALTHVAAATPAGAVSTLEVRVNDILWHEKSMLFGQGPAERTFVTRTTDEGQTIVEFGNGRTGARLPTGQDNVRAVYRKGLGLDGLVGAGQLNMLMSRPLGLKAATNPRAATGAADPEPRDQARRNAPLKVLTLDRTVSLQDYEDFSRGFGGIAKALATWSWDGRRRKIFITVAGPNGAAVEVGSELHTSLLHALKQAGDPLVQFTVQSYRSALFRLAARVKVHADFITENVLTEVEGVLRSHFSFDVRQFGQPVMLSEVIAVIQAVPGVIAVDVDRLYRRKPKALQPQPLFFTALRRGDIFGRVASDRPQPRLIAELPRMGSSGGMRAAELLTLHPGPLDYLEVMT